MAQKTQHILVLIQENKLVRKASTHAFKLAKIFQSDVAFAYLPGPKSKSKPTLPIKEIEKLNSENINFKEIRFGNSDVEPNNCIKQLEAIFIVCAFSNDNLNGFFKKNEVFRYLYKARIPSILISQETHDECDYKNIVVPVDCKKETKEKMIWASYFGRFNNATIHLFVANEKSESVQRRIKATLLFTKRLYEQFNFEYKIVKSNSSSIKIKQEAYRFSEQFNSDLIVLLFQNNNSWFANRFGPRQIKRLLLKKRNPILFINPLKDYYLPCN